MKDKQASAALWTGISLLVMTVAAGLAYGLLHNQIFVREDLATTMNTIATNPWLLISELILWNLIVALDIQVSVGLYRVFADGQKKSALVIMITRLVYTAFLLGATGFLYGAFAPEQALEVEALFTKVWYAGLVLFGIHLTVLAGAAWKNPDFHWIIGALLAVAGPSYTLIHLFYLLGDVLGTQWTAWANSLQGILVLPMTLAELSLAVGLLILAGKNRASKRSTVVS